MGVWNPRVGGGWKRGLFAASLALLIPNYGSGQTPCRHALILALDVSGSVNEKEYRAQMVGVADALLAPGVQDLLFSYPGAPVHLSVFEWSSTNHQDLLQDWVVLDEPATLIAVSKRIRTTTPKRQGLKTAMGEALGFGAALMEQLPHCWRHTIDISADGKNNAGRLPSQTYLDPRFQSVVVNALVIGDVDDRNDTLSPAQLQTYFEKHVLHGPGAFTQVANGFPDYANAMTRKLIRELKPIVLGEISDTKTRFPL